MSSRVVQIAVPTKWILPAFFSSASPEEAALVLDAAAKVVPWVSKLVHTHHDAQDASRRQGVDEAVEAALRLLRTDELERAMREKHDAQVAMYDARSQHDEAKAKIIELTQELRSAEQRTADAEARGRAAGVVECDARLHAELASADRRRSALEVELRRWASDATKERDALRQKCEALAGKVVELEAIKQKLETPSGRGAAGEANVTQIVQDLGYEVVDTSTGSEKTKYGDLLCIGVVEGRGAPSCSTEPPRIRLAIEVKNRQKLTPSDVAGFEGKVRKGVADGLYEGGLLLSQRCAVPGLRGAAAQAMLLDAEGKPTIPMAYVGTDRHSSSPVVMEHVEVAIQAQMHLCEQAMHVRSAMASSEIDDHDVQRVQAHFAELATFTTDMFAEFAKHQTILDSARQSLDAMKASTLVSYRTARRLNASVPWLQRPMAQLGCEKGIDHAVRLAAEGKLDWSHVSHKDSLQKVMGKGCVQGVVHEELRRLAKEARDELPAKRRRECSDDGSGSD